MLKHCESRSEEMDFSFTLDTVLPIARLVISTPCVNTLINAYCSISMYIVVYLYTFRGILLSRWLRR